MRFKVPQFIDIEDKLFAGLTFKQFAYLLGGGGLAYIAFRFLPLIFALILGPAAAGLGIALAFYRYNERPFIYTLEALFKYYTKSRLYLWKKQEKKAVVKQ